MYSIQLALAFTYLCTSLHVGFKTVQKIYLGKADWHALFTPSNFFQKYKYVVICAVHRKSVLRKSVLCSLCTTRQIASPTEFKQNNTVYLFMDLFIFGGAVIRASAFNI
jgi:hypothetical protein